MSDFQASVVIPRSREETFKYLRNPGNLLNLFPDIARQLEVKLPEMVEQGSILEINFKVMGRPIQIVQEITDLRPGERIVATQLKGPLKKWIHEQRFADTADGGTLLTNTIDFDPPGGLLGFIVTRKQVLSHLEDWVGRGHELLRKTLTKIAPE